ncbi:MAG: glycosyltransferase [Lachnospiraceae bacterium]|nr:glycosyltransferase [Lachnospiraceae bacterium]
MSDMISVIIPAFNEEDMIKTAYDEIRQVILSLNTDYEFIFVDDGSTDKTFDEVKEISLSDPGVHCVSFSRNFGKESAIFAGLKEAKGNCCVVMDCDLQHPADVIPEMYRLWKEGFEIVEGVKKDRGKESIIYRLMSKIFYSVISRCSNIDLKDASDFVLLDRMVIDSMLSFPEAAPFFRGLSRWVGFRSVKVPFEVSERRFGKSKWSTTGLIKYAIHNITIFSADPLQLVTVMGVIFIIASIFLGGEALYRYFTQTALGGFTTVIGLILLTGGIIMISLGIIGLYISKIYDEVKDRPRYIIEKRI